MNRKERRHYERHPITSQQEADDIFNFLVKTTVAVLKIDRAEASLRVKALQKSGILDSCNPDSLDCQRKIDQFLSIPSDKHGEPLPFSLETDEFQAAFLYAVQNKELVESYDRLTGSHLYDCMDALQTQGIDYQIDLATGRTHEEFKKFTLFFRNTIWNRFKHERNIEKSN